MKIKMFTLGMLVVFVAVLGVVSGCSSVGENMAPANYYQGHVTVEGVTYAVFIEEVETPQGADRLVLLRFTHEGRDRAIIGRDRGGRLWETLYHYEGATPFPTKVGWEIRTKRKILVDWRAIDGAIRALNVAMAEVCNGAHFKERWETKDGKRVVSNRRSSPI